MERGNKFYDLNQLPQDEGLLIFGISMSRIDNAQSARHCFEYLRYLDTKIVKTKGIGAVFLYADYLYFLSRESSDTLRNRFLSNMTKHRNGLLSLLERDTAWVTKAFSFLTFGQAMIDASREWNGYWKKLWSLYDTDRSFSECIARDIRLAKKDAGDENAVKFFLEEILFFYLVSKQVLALPNGFVGGKEKWVLHCYPGKPLCSEAYLYQKNLLGIRDSGNRYEQCYYDLSGKTLYDFSRIDIDTFDFSE